MRACTSIVCTVFLWESLRVLINFRRYTGHYLVDTCRNGTCRHLREMLLISNVGFGPRQVASLGSMKADAAAVHLSTLEAATAEGGDCHSHVALFVLYGESLMKFTGWHENEFFVHG